MAESQKAQRDKDIISKMVQSVLENETSEGKKVKKLDVFKKLDVTGLAKELGRSISAPPPGLFMEKPSSKDDEGMNPFLSDPAYAEFYYSMQPLDPRLPKPQVKPPNTSYLSELRLKEKLSHEEVAEKKRKSLEPQFTALKISEDKRRPSIEKAKMKSIRNDSVSPYEQFMEFNKDSFSTLPQPQNLSNQSMPYYPYPEISQQFPMYQMPVNQYQYQPAYQSNPEYQQPNPQQQPHPHSKQGQMNFYMMSSNINIGNGGNGPYPPSQYNPYEYGNYYYNPVQPMVGQEYYPNKIDLKYVIHNFSSLCSDHNGSKILQTFIDNASSYHREKLWMSIKGKFHLYVKDVFGNYILQKLLEKGNELVRGQIVQMMKDHIHDFIFQTYSCRVVQKVIEIYRDNDEVADSILSVIKGHVVEIIQDNNGNHVIQKCFECFEPKKVAFMYEEISQEVEKLIFHPFGCRVIQRLLETAKDMKPLYKIGEVVTENVYNLTLCQHGNYVVQLIVEKGDEKHKEKVYSCVLEHFVHFCGNKFGSNVAEKCVKHSDNSYKLQLIARTLQRSEVDNESFLLIQVYKLVRDAFGNYVIQRIFEYGNEEVKKSLVKTLLTSNDSFLDIKKSNYGKHVVNMIEKYTREMLKSKQPAAVVK